MNSIRPSLKRKVKHERDTHVDTTSLIARVTQYGVLLPEAVVTEYMRFLQLKIAANDWNATKLSPSAHVDKVWHLHVLDTKRYATDCKQLCGRIIHHDPDGALDHPAQQIRYQRARELYKEIFKSDPPADIWPTAPAPDAAIQSQPIQKIEIIIEELTGPITHMLVSPSATVADLKQAIYTQLPRHIPTEQQRLIFSGRVLDDGKTLQNYNIQESSIVYLLLRLTGC